MIELIDLSKNFGDIRAVDSVSLKIREGEMLGLVGPNGSGKSTLLKMMLGISRPTSGKVLMDGKELTERDWKEIRKRIGYMPERVVFYDNLTGTETVALFARIKGGDPARADDLLTRVGLAHAAGRKVGGYSKGMRQRLNLAQALSNDPDLLVLDEPSSGLDPVGTKEFYAIIDGVRARKKLTVVLSSHILAEIEDRIDRVAVMKNGLLKAVGSLEELYTSLRLPLKVTLSVNGAGDEMAALLRNAGAMDVVIHGGRLVADVPRGDKLKILSTLMERQDGFHDLSIREPNLEEVFFGVH
jgi:Cu-processing system ATP-binding protein